jgi:hypothetical protein
LTDQFDGRSPTTDPRTPQILQVFPHHRAKVDPIDIFKNEATAIEFSGKYGSKSLHH